MDNFLDRKRVLILDDEVLIGLDLEELLLGRGLDVEVFGHSDQAAAALRATLFHLAILDVHSGRPNSGLTAAESARDAGVPILFCTGGDRPHGFDSADLISKPYDRDQVATKVLAILGSTVDPSEIPTSLGSRSSNDSSTRR